MGFSRSIKYKDLFLQTNKFDGACLIGPPSTQLELLLRNNEVWKMPKLLKSINQCKKVGFNLSICLY